jgi:flagellar protein FlaF
VNAIWLAAEAYSGGNASTRTPRAIEYEVFSRLTRRLRSVGAGQDGPGSMAEALHDNLRLWSAIATDVAEPTNALPAPLRARLFYLWEFTRLHTRKVLAGEASADVLVDINTAVMRGLRGEVPGR